MSVALGARLGPYEILAPLGAGGIGEVYRARDTRLGREVALKILTAHVAHDAEQLRRFEQEARAASTINHPNILTVYDLGTASLEAGGAPYLVAELLDGAELRAQLNDGALPVRRAIEYAQQIAAGLAAAHEQGITHRDLKPENLFVTKDGRVKILDFGLAKLKPPRNAPVGSDTATQKQLTNPGTVMGTVAYMSPEQVRGETVDHRSDIFSFGLILHEMLSGRRVFQRATMAETMTAILKEDVPELSAANSKITPGLEKLVRRCLEKQPERRFHSAHDLTFALEAVATPSSSDAHRTEIVPALNTVITVPHSRWRAGSGWLVAAALLLTTLGLAWASYARRPAAEMPLLKLSLLPPERTSFGHIAISPDGNWLAFTGATGSKVQLWVRALAGNEAKSLEGTEGASFPFWSPDSRFIGFFTGSKLKKVEVGGGAPTTICDAGVGTGGSWNRAGVILFSYLGARSILHVPSTGGAAPITRLPNRQQLDTHYAPHFLPDGRHFICYVSSGGKEVRGIYLGSLDGGVEQRLLSDDSNATYAKSSTGKGYLLFGREGALLAQPFDAQTRQLSGEPVLVAARVATLLGTVTNFRYGSFSVSETGMLVFDPQPLRQRSQVLSVDRSGRKINALEGLDNVNVIRLAPDDRRFAMARISQENGNNDVWLSDVAGVIPTRFTFDPGNDIFMVWSPNGNRLVWCSNRSGVFNLYEKEASGVGQDRLLLQSESPNFPTDWSHDGRYIIYRQSNLQTKHDIWAFPLFNERKPFPVLQTEANEAAATLSPDGRWLAYSSDETGRYEVYVQSFPGGGGIRQVSTAGGMGPLWRGDGKELYFHAPDGKLLAAPITSGVSLEVGMPATLFEFRAAGNLITPYYSVTRDGQRFLLNTIMETETNAPLTVVVNWTAEAKR